MSLPTFAKAISKGVGAVGTRSAKERVPDYHPTEMNENHHKSLKQYVNDVIGLERDITNAISIQIEDDKVKAYPELLAVLQEIVRGSERRIELFKALSDKEGGNFGAAIKEGVTAVTGALAGLYGKVREDPISRMVRDDVVAMHVSAVSYSMLLTLGLSIGHSETADLATEALNACPPLVLKLTDLLPQIVASEVAEEGALASPSAVQVANDRIQAAWKQA